MTDVEIEFAPTVEATSIRRGASDATDTAAEARRADLSCFDIAG